MLMRLMLLAGLLLAAPVLAQDRKQPTPEQRERCAREAAERVYKD